MNELIAQFHFLRPWWLLLVPPFALTSAYLYLHHGHSGWRQYIHTDKLKHLLINESAGSSRRLPGRELILTLVLILGAVALAGPSWQALPDKLASGRQAMVILFDLSPSMLASDVKPDRLTHARFKLIDLLRQQIDGETALVIYAGDAHRVTPLTDDPATIEALVHTLHPHIMPLPGSQPEDAVALALTLFTHADHRAGDILLITDGVHPDAAATISQTLPPEFRLSILGVGTRQGAAIPDGDSGYLLDQHGNTITALLNVSILEELATATKGHYVTSTVDDADIEILTESRLRSYTSKDNNRSAEFDRWHDAGYWLVLLLLPLAAYSFRRHVLWLTLPLCLLPPDGHALDWNDLWLTKNQQAANALQENDPKLAARLFTDQNWKAVASYRSAEYSAAIAAWADARTTDDFYNLGNAFAHAGDLEQAIEHYRLAIALYAGNEDARFNLKLLEDLKIAETTEDSLAQQRPRSGEKETAGDEKQGQADTDTSQQGQAPRIGGTVGGNNTLDQRAMGTNDQPAETQRLQSIDSQDTAQDATQDATRLNEVESARATGSSEPPTTLNNALHEEYEGTALNPYSEQWLRNLPQDPGGYMRRKLAYQSQMRSQDSTGNEPEIPTGRY